MRAEVQVSGNVQGVFFRAETEKRAKALSLNGFVENLKTGQVKAVFEGEKENIEKIIEWIKAGGPELAEVLDVEVSFKEKEEFNNFKIRY